MFNKYKIDILLNILALFLIVLFFLPLFYPTLSLFITSEIGISDIWQFNIPVKYLMYQAMQQGVIPLWSSAIGTGFPIYAESQMGFFNITNQIIYRIFPFMVAFNVQYLLIFFSAFVGMYSLLRYWKLTYVPSFIGAFAFTFSGFYITHISHQNMIQTASFMPWILLFFLLFQEKKKIILFLITLLLISQQLLSGYFQIALITWIVIGCYLLFSKQLRKSIILFGVLVGLGLLLSAVQILPTAELITHTDRAGGLSPKENTYFSYPFKHLITFLDPFLLGSPKNGTYPHFNKFNGSIFWENTGYIGIIPLVLAGFSLIYIRKKKNIAILLGILAVCFLLMTGSNSPFYFIHTFPPFNRFRIPSRYLFGFLFALSALAAFGADSLLKSKRVLIGAIILVFTVLNIFLVWHAYQPTAPVASWFKDPETATYIKSTHSNARVYSIFDGHLWIKYFLKNGWNNKDDYYFFRNSISPNYNIIPNIAQYDAYVGRVNTKRQVAYNAVVLAGAIDHNNGTYSLSSASAKLLGMEHVGHIISPGLLSGDDLKQVYKTKNNPSSLPSYMVYENRSVLPRAYVVHDYVEAQTVEHIQSILASETFDPKKMVVSEEKLPFTVNKTCIENPTECESSAGVKGDTGGEITLNVKTAKDGILVLADSYYPGWSVTVDGVSSKIYPVNLNQRAVIISKGEHSVKFIYKPESFKRGLLISFGGYLITISLLLFVIVSPRPDTFFQKQLRSFHL